jgi:hypothetical protein
VYYGIVGNATTLCELQFSLNEISRLIQSNDDFRRKKFYPAEQHNPTLFCRHSDSFLKQIFEPATAT